jgi:DNA-3-methyladenine glycosylase II
VRGQRHAATPTSGSAGLVLPIDLALGTAIGRAYRLDHLPSQDELSAIAEPWRPYRTLATSYVFATAFDA